MSSDVSAIYRLFAGMLSYPTAALPAHVSACATLLATDHPEATNELSSFQAFVGQSDCGHWEEVYTAAFDLQVVCYPYVGYQLFGESYKRGAFMAWLKEQYRGRGYSPAQELGNAFAHELPDHLAVVLGFLAALEDEGFRQTLVDDCLLPAIEKMLRAFREDRSPYRDVLRALYLTAGGNDRAKAVKETDQAVDLNRAGMGCCDGVVQEGCNA